MNMENEKAIRAMYTAACHKAHRSLDDLRCASGTVEARRQARQAAEQIAVARTLLPLLGAGNVRDYERIFETLAEVVAGADKVVSLRGLKEQLADGGFVRPRALLVDAASFADRRPAEEKNVRVETLDAEPREIPIKRLRLPVVVKATCPTCGGTAECDLSSGHLGYPTIGKPMKLMLSCYDRDGNETCYTDVDVTLGFTLTATNVRKSDW